MAKNNYIDGFVFPIPRIHLDQYQEIAEQVAAIWKEHGALSYLEYVGDDMSYEGTRSFVNMVDANEDEVIIFGWVVFESREDRDIANQKVHNDARMIDLVAPIIDPSNMIFNPMRMAYGGFRPLVK